MAFEIENKRGQITIFVFVAVIIVSAMIILFLVAFRSPRINATQEFNPENFIDKCIRNEVGDIANKILLHGGEVNPSDYKLHKNLQIAYICKNINYYEPCIMQKPSIISSIEEEIEINVHEKVEECFTLLEIELEKRNYDFSGGDVTVNVVLKPRFIETLVERDMRFEKGDFSFILSKFTVLDIHPAYDLAWIAGEIANQEAKFCYFENSGFNILYNEYDVRKDVSDDSTKIYNIKHKLTENEMNIAIRGCAIPAGF